MQIPGRPPPGSSSGPSSQGHGTGLALVSGRIAFCLWFVSSEFSCCLGDPVVVTALAQASTSSADSSGSRSVLLVAEHLGSTVFGGPVMFSDIADLAGDTFGDTPTSRCLLLLFFSAGLFTLPRLDVGAVGSGRSLRYRSKVPVSFNLKLLLLIFLS